MTGNVVLREPILVDIEESFISCVTILGVRVFLIRLLTISGIITVHFATGPLAYANATPS